MTFVAEVHCTCVLEPACASPRHWYRTRRRCLGHGRLSISGARHRTMYNQRAPVRIRSAGYSPGRKPRTLDLRFRQAPQAAVVAWPLFLRAGTGGAVLGPDAVGVAPGLDLAGLASGPFESLLAVEGAGSSRRNDPPACCLSGGEIDLELDMTAAGAAGRGASPLRWAGGTAGGNK